MEIMRNLEPFRIWVLEVGIYMESKSGASESHERSTSRIPTNGGKTHGESCPAEKDQWEAGKK